MSDRLLTADLLARLQRHYIKPGDPMPGGMFMPEVTLGSRRADALYVGFFSSRGRYLVGHELKVSRADWLHELDQPAKAEAWEPNCHQWYVVAPSVVIVPPEELPHGWGLMVPNARTKTRMDIIVKAEMHADRNPSWEATHALVQRADSLRMAATEEARRKAVETVHEEVDKQVAARLAYSQPERLTEQRDRLQGVLDEVGEILGFKIATDGRDWDPEAVGVDFLRNSFGRWLAADKAVATNLTFRISALKGARESIKDAEKAIEALREGVSAN